MSRSCCRVILVLLVFLMATTSRMARSMTTTSVPPTAAKLTFHWFRHGDLRLHDNSALVYSAQNSQYCIPIFCFDPKVFGDTARTEFGSLKCGPRRAKFVLESVSDLRSQLESMGSALAVFQGAPSDVFQKILQQIKKNTNNESSSINVSIVCQEEVLKEEQDAVKAVRSALKKHCPQSQVKTVWGSTLYNLMDLPFDEDLSDMPNVFTPFRNKVEKKAVIGKPLDPPRSLPLPASVSVEYKAIGDALSFLPTLKDLGYTDEQIETADTVDPRGVMTFRGGETAALARLQEYIWDKDLLRAYFDTRNGMLGADYSSKLSPWLAHGCLSPRTVAAECQKYEQQVVANKSTYWLVFELLWRDFCKFFCLKHGNSVFFPGGTTGKSDKKWSRFAKNFEAWKEGRTGYPLVDANMRELNATGFMSNRGRQNVCSFLAIDLNYDWRYGADWFESQLLDYDVYSNWFNWCAGAGMTGGRLNRFNIVKQSKDYDQHGDYVRHWLPELKDVPTDFVHEPWKMTQFQQMQYNVKLGVDYPNPIVPPSSSQQQAKYDKNRKGGGKQRKPNKSGNRNRHQKYEMKSVKQGKYQIQD